LFPLNAERAYTLGLQKFAQILAEETNRILVPQLQSILASAAEISPPKNDSVRLDQGFAKKIADLLLATRASVDRRFPEREMRRLAREAGEDIARMNKKEITKVLSSVLGVDIFTPSPFLEDAMEAFIAQNVSLIKTIPERHFAKVESQVFEAIRSGQRHEELAEEIEEGYGVSESNAARIARDQTNKFNGQLTMLEQTNAGVESYIWRTALDERVRPEHAEREGEQFNWTEPPEDGHPGEPINCRCSSEPALEGLL
jgi:SPP1 gp7 family putative phage head morphogenesis protein